MADVVLSSAVRNNLLSLQNTAALMGKTQERLASGLRVGSALDDPTAFFTASSLNSRASDLTRLLDSVGLAVQTLRSADNAISSITKLVEAAQATARQALQASAGAQTFALNLTGDADINNAADVAATHTSDGVDYDPGGGGPVALDLAAIDGHTITVTVNGVAETYTFDGSTGQDLIDFLDGLDGIGAAAVGGDLVITADDNETAFSIQFSSSVVGDATGLSEGTYNPTNAFFDDINGTITFQLGDGSFHTLNFVDGSEDEIVGVFQLEARLAEISAEMDGVTLSIDEGSGFLTIASTSSETLRIESTGGAAGDFDSTGSLVGTHAPTVTGTNSVQRESLQEDYNRLLQQITEMAGDGIYNGINLLNGDNLTVIFNEDGTSSLTIGGVTFDADGLGLSTAAGDDFQSNATINAALTELDTAIRALRSQASTFGSNMSIVETRQDFTKKLVNTLETGAANLTLADTNEEGANMLALQTRQQLSTVALSLAAQADQNVLRLF